MNFLKIMIFFVWFYASCLIAAGVSTMSLRELKIRIRFCQAQVCFRTNSTANSTLSHFQTCNKCAKALKHGSTTPKYKRVRWIKSKSDSNGRACALIVHFNSKVNSIFRSVYDCSNCPNAASTNLIKLMVSFRLLQYASSQASAFWTPLI